MKIHILLVLMIMSAALGCKKEGLYTRTAGTTLNAENSILLRQGALVATSGITVDGVAEIRQSGNATYVQLTQFGISEGPDLKVYLSTTDSPTDFVNLGSLQYTGGVYAIPSDVMHSDYDYVLIHCQQYNHLFAIAKLQ